MLNVSCLKLARRKNLLIVLSPIEKQDVLILQREQGPHYLTKVERQGLLFDDAIKLWELVHDLEPVSFPDGIADHI